MDPHESAKDDAVFFQASLNASHIAMPSAVKVAATVNIKSDAKAHLTRLDHLLSGRSRCLPHLSLSRYLQHRSQKDHGFGNLGSADCSLQRSKHVFDQGRGGSSLVQYCQSRVQVLPREEGESQRQVLRDSLCTAPLRLPSFWPRHALTATISMLNITFRGGMALPLASHQDNLPGGSCHSIPSGIVREMSTFLGTLQRPRNCARR